MSLNKGKVFQVVLGLVFVALFTYMSLVLIGKQNKPYSFQSFISDQHSGSIILNDIDRVANKRITSVELGITNYALAQGYDRVLNSKTKSYNDIIGERLMMSYSEGSFVVVLQYPNLGIGDVLQVLEEELHVATAKNESKITIESDAYFFKVYNDFLVVSDQEIQYYPGEYDELRYGNSDYLKLIEGKVERYLTAPGILYSASSFVDSIKGAPVGYKDAFNLIPADFDEGLFFGSKRFSKDKQYLFNSNEGFEWCDTYLSVLKKDSLEIVIAPVSFTRDLRLILEEETLDYLGDSSQIPVQNLSSYDVLEIHSKYDWSEIIPGLTKEVSHFTQLGNYNLIATSKEAMNWVLSSWQLGNVAAKSAEIENLLNNYMPHRMNRLLMERTNTGWSITGNVNTENQMLAANVLVELEGGNVEGIQNYFEIDLEFAPEKMFVVSKAGLNYVLAYGGNMAAVCSSDGELLFTRKWASNITDIQVVKQGAEPDFLVFTKNGLDRFSLDNKGFYGLPKALPSKTYGGKALVYSDNNQLRVFVGEGNSVVCYQPGDGLAKVQGWVFPVMSAPLNQFLYRQVQGKDYLLIQNMLNEIQVVNRRGEQRLKGKSAFIVESMDDRIMGSNENSLYIQGYNKGYLYRYFLNNNVVDSTELDGEIQAINQGWIYKESNNEFWQESTNLFMHYDEFGFVKDEIIKPSALSEFAGYLTTASNTAIFADNRNNKLYLLDERGALITPNALSGSSAWTTKDGILFTSAGSKLIAYELK
ncbi:MAG: hypothetical protein MK078_11150 [Crocinitomicaceae bacterium]|nr:hypothetical protein [Crocinitomicaceae bacterium]